MKSRMKKEVRVFVIPAIIVSCILSSCNVRTNNEEITDGESTAQDISKVTDVSTTPETEVV